MLHLKHIPNFYNNITSAESQTRSITFPHKKLATKENITDDKNKVGINPTKADSELFVVFFYSPYIAKAEVG